jgi:hypothetical protein
VPETVLIRDAVPGDWPAIWAFMRVIVRAGETFSRHPTDGYVGLHIMYRRL